MTQEHYEKLLNGIDRFGRRMKRDKKFALETYVHLGIMTPKGNLRRDWKQIQKITGMTFHSVKVATRRARD